MGFQGYYRFPDISPDGNIIVYVCEDDLWMASGLQKYCIDGTELSVRRITTTQGNVSCPRISPDGTMVAYTCDETGCDEIYVAPLMGGPSRRLTWLGAEECSIQCWTVTTREIIFSADSSQYLPCRTELFAVSSEPCRENSSALQPRKLGWGPASTVHARALSDQSSGVSIVLGKWTDDPAIENWKGYRGGCGGEIWLSTSNAGRMLDFPAGSRPNTFTLVQFEGSIGFPILAPCGDLLAVTDSSSLNIHGGKPTLTRGNLVCLEASSLEPAVSSSSRVVEVLTEHTDFYVRNPRWTEACDQVVYQCGGSLFILQRDRLGNCESYPIHIDHCGPRSQIALRYIDSALEFFEHAFDVHPKGHSIALISRGKLFSMGLWNGPAVQHGVQQGVRYRLATYLSDGKRFVCISDGASKDYEVLEVHYLNVAIPPKVVDGVRVGRATHIQASPKSSCIAIINDMSQVFVVDVDKWTSVTVDASPVMNGIKGVSWSPDGRWLAYAYHTTAFNSVIRLFDTSAKKVKGSRPSASNSLPHGVYSITTEVLCDTNPTFSPEGDYLYFLSSRNPLPVSDNISFNYGFPATQRPYVIALRSKVGAPLQDDLQPPESESEESTESSSDSEEGENESAVTIDFVGIEKRVAAIPVRVARYDGLIALNDGEIMYRRLPLQLNSSRIDDDDDDDDDGENRGTLFKFNLKSRKEAKLIEDVLDVRVSMDRRAMTVLTMEEGDDEPEFYTVSAGSKLPEDDSDDEEIDTTVPGRESGLMDIEKRVTYEVDVMEEFQQMFKESWRLMRDNFWKNDMNEVDWEVIFSLYYPLVSRVSSPSELADVIVEMQKEVRTSHAYHTIGEERDGKIEDQSYVGADFTWSEDHSGYVVSHIVAGDVWDSKTGGPLARCGAVSIGDVLMAVDGKKVGRECPPQRLLVNKLDVEVMLTFFRGQKAISCSNPSDQSDKSSSGAKKKQKKKKGNESQPSEKMSANEKRRADRDLSVFERLYCGGPMTTDSGGNVQVRVRTIGSEMQARYRDWVESMRSEVHRLTNETVGYVHIVDMEEPGLSEFHRYYVKECQRRALIVDVRHNGGGDVSELIVEKLARRRLAYEVPRRPLGQVPYPSHVVDGPMVMIADECTGSDGDIVTHAFKELGLGPIVGVRTWGGVVGTEGGTTLVDGSSVCQPQWGFETTQNVKGGQCNIENHGVEPTLEVRASPDHYIDGVDIQLQTAAKVAMELMEKGAPSRYNQMAFVEQFGSSVRI